MTSENVFKSGADSALVLILPIAMLAIVVVKLWPLLIVLAVLAISWKIWRNYQWQQFCSKVNPYFKQLVDRNRGRLTALNLSAEANTTQSAAERFLEWKAKELGVSPRTKQNIKIYTFNLGNTLQQLLDDTEDEELELETDEMFVTQQKAALTKQQSREPSVKDIAKLVESKPSKRATTKKSSSSKKSSPSTTESTSKPDSESVSTTKPTETESTENKAESKSEAIAEDKDIIKETEASTQEEDKLVLKQAELAKRLDLHTSTIAKRKSEADFSLWSQSKDPEGIAWQYLPKEKVFVVAPEE